MGQFLKKAARASGDSGVVQLLMLPGLGGDHRMAHHQLSLPFSVIAPDYIPWNDGESLADYSERFYRSLIDRRIIDGRRSIYVGGSSLGGAVAQEICRVSRARGVILIGSLRKGSELRGLVGFTGRYIASFLPDWIYNIAGLFLPFVMHAVSRISDGDVALSKAMYEALPRGFYRAGFCAIARWQGCEIHVPVLRIHGRHDHIIPFDIQMAADRVIENGRHLIAMSHPVEVNNAISQFIERMETRNNFREKT